jgi:hypothetical protein
MYSILILYALAVLVIKLLLLAVLIRIFSPREKITLFTRLLTVFMLAYYLASFFVRIFLCTPISTFWYRANGTCVNYFVLFSIDSFISLITDGAILVLPLLLAWSLHLPLSKKIKIVAILGAGGLATVTNIYRLSLMFSEGRSADQTHFWIKLLYTGYVLHFPIICADFGYIIDIERAAETSLGIICACLPAISALVKKSRERS